MAHLKKFGKSATGHMTKHYERVKDEFGEYIKFGNQDIDINKTHLNYNLSPDRSNQVEFIKNRCKEVRCLNREDVKVMCSWVVTKPKNIRESEEGEFFKETYKFLENRYGKENVVSAYVHKDEITPHMHFSFVPVVYDKKKELYKVSAKEKVSRNDLRSFHTDLEKHLEKYFGKEVGILNEATKEGNKSIEELKKGTAIKEFNSIVKKRQYALEILKNIEKDIQPLEDKRKQLEGKIEGLEGRVLSLEEVESINVKKTITGAIRGISYEDILNLKKTAKYINQIVEMKKSLDIKENKLIEKEKKINLIPMNQQVEIAKIKSENQELKKYKEAFNKLPDVVKKQLIPSKNHNKDYDMTR